MEDENGDIVYLARKDDQVKHMGYRIELGEVETAINSIDGVFAAICFFDHNTDKIVCCVETKLDEASLSSATKAHIPNYMRPNIWRRYTSLPMNANGKVDRKALKEEYMC